MFFAAEDPDIELPHLVVRHLLDARLANLLRFVGTHALEVGVVEHHDAPVLRRANVDFRNAPHLPRQFKGRQTVFRSEIPRASVRDNGDRIARLASNRLRRVPVGGKNESGSGREKRR